MTSIVRGVIEATETTIAGLACEFLLASSTAAGTDTNQKYTAGGGGTVRITGKGDQALRQILITYPVGTTVNQTNEAYDDGGAAVRFFSGVIATLRMMPSQLTDTGYQYQAIHMFECTAYFGERYPPLITTKTLPPA